MDCKPTQHFIVCHSLCIEIYNCKGLGLGLVETETKTFASRPSQDQDQDQDLASQYQDHAKTLTVKTKAKTKTLKKWPRVHSRPRPWSRLEDNKTEYNFVKTKSQTIHEYNLLTMEVSLVS